jgi:hypothetical protein
VRTDVAILRALVPAAVAVAPNFNPRPPAINLSLARDAETRAFGMVWVKSDNTDRSARSAVFYRSLDGLGLLARTATWRPGTVLLAPSGMLYLVFQNKQFSPRADDLGRAVGQNGRKFDRSRHC